MARLLQGASERLIDRHPPVVADEEMKMMEPDEVRHALRTPLTVIKGVLSLLARADDILDPMTRADLIARSVQQVQILEAAIDRVELTFPSTAEDDKVIVLYEEDANGMVTGPMWPAAESA